MGGFTQIILKNCSSENVAKQNELLKKYRIPKQYRFQDLAKDQEEEYKWFVRGKGEFPDHLFPKEKIKSLEDFRKFWSPDALGEVFVPSQGRLNFDCYFGRTPDKVMKALGKFITDNIKEIECTEGSFTTFMERSMDEQQIKKCKRYNIYEEARKRRMYKIEYWHPNGSLQTNEWYYKSKSDVREWIKSIRGSVYKIKFLGWE